MKADGLGTAKPAAEDRNPSAVSQYYNLSVWGPVGATVVWTYTVPTGRILRADLVMTSQTLIQIGAAAQFSVIEVERNSAIMVVAFLFSNTPGDQNAMGLGSGVLLVAGNDIRCLMAHGGTSFIRFTGAATGTEFDTL